MDMNITRTTSGIQRAAMTMRDGEIVYDYTESFEPKIPAPTWEVEIPDWTPQSNSTARKRTSLPKSIITASVRWQAAFWMNYRGTERNGWRSSQQ